MKQINVKKFLSLSHEEQVQYISILEFCNPKELLSVKISELTYNEVKQIFKQLSKPECDIEFIFITALKITKKNFLKLPIQNYFQIKKYIEKFFISLKQNEITLLQSVDANISTWEMAGGNELNEFADVLPLSQLSKIYGGYPFDYGEKNYIEIIYLLRMNNKQNQVENEYQKLIYKTKNNG